LRYRASSRIPGAGPANGLFAVTPFNQQRNLIHLFGPPTAYLVSARARAALAIFLVGRVIGNVAADVNGHKDPGGGFEGIDGPIVAITGSDPAPMGAS